MSYLNADLKSWSIGTIPLRSHDGRSYQILTENGLTISRNHMHLRLTRVKPVPVDKLVSPHISNVKADKLIITPSGDPAASNAVKATKPHFIKTAAKTNDVPHRTRSGREVCKPPCYRD